MKIVLLLIVLGMVATLMQGCLSTPDTRYRPFTEDWYKQERSERELEERKKRIEQGDLILFGDKDKERAAVKVDEEGPRLNVGQEKGWSLDLDYDDGPEAGVRYEMDWQFVKPKRGQK